MRVLLTVAFIAISWGCQSTPVDYGSILDKPSNGEQVSIDRLNDALLNLPDLPRHMERLVDLEQQALQLALGAEGDKLRHNARFD